MARQKSAIPLFPMAARLRELLRTLFSVDGCIIHKGAVIKNSVVLAGAEIGEGVHVENQVVDKLAKILHVKEVISDPALPGYIKRNDII